MNSPSILLSTTFAIYAILVTMAAGRAIRSPLMAAAWLIITGGLAASGLLLNFDSFPPPVLRLIFPTVMVTTIVCNSSLARSWLKRWSLSGMIAFQAFRLPLELIMHQAAREGVMPPQMTFTGRNFDILTGLLAIPLALLAARVPQAVIWLWNLGGLALLINVVSVAIHSVPGPYRAFFQEPANVWIGHAPFVWLPAVLVPLALAGHILIARKLLASGRETLVLGAASAK